MPIYWGVDFHARQQTICYCAVFFIVSFQLFAVAQPGTNHAERLLRREMQERRIPGLQVAVVPRGKIVLVGSFGIANIQDSIPVTNKSVLFINSCTKAFTGVAMMQFVEDGKIDLAAPVSSYLDGLPASWQPVTVRQLLTHVSGLPNILKFLIRTQESLSGEIVKIQSGRKCRPCRWNSRPVNG